MCLNILDRICEKLINRTKKKIIFWYFGKIVVGMFIILIVMYKLKSHKEIPKNVPFFVKKISPVVICSSVWDCDHDPVITILILAKGDVYLKFCRFIRFHFELILLWIALFNDS